MVVIPLPRRFNLDRAKCVALSVPRAIHERSILETHIMHPALQHNIRAGSHELIKSTHHRKESFQSWHEFI